MVHFRTAWVRLAAVSAVIVLCLSALPLTAFAAYENTYTNTGNQAADLVGVAKTQVGYAEGSNNYNKYGAYYNNPNASWCGYFISWCARQAGIPTAVLPNTGSSTHFFKVGTYHARTSGYTPQIGDILLYGVYNDAYHVSIVERYDASTSTVYVIDGNWENKVSRHSTTLSNTEIAGFVTPNYTSDITELSAVNMVIPSVIAAGNSFSISGLLCSPNTIRTVTVSILDADGQTRVSQSASPNATSYDVAGLDANIPFGSLPVGSYSYIVTATDSAQTKRWTYIFEVVSTIDMTIADVVAPTTVVQGNTFSISGVITCAQTLTNVSVSIYDTDGAFQTGGSATPNATSYNIKGIDNYVSFGKLTVGDYTMVVSARSAGGSQVWEYPFTVVSADNTVTYTLTDAVYPTALGTGSGFSIYGTVSATEKLTAVSVSVYDSANTRKLHASAAPNATTYNIHNLDSSIAFGTLTAGSYTYTVTAKSANGEKSWEYPFTVSDSAVFTLTDAVYPTHLEVGQSCSISGTVTANRNLTKVSILITDASGKTCLSASASPNTASYRLGALDTQLRFGTLSAGSYTYSIRAETASGSKQWDYAFTVGNAAVTYAPGDINADGCVDMLDAMALYLHVAGMSSLTEEQFSRVGTETADMFTAMALYSYVSGITPTYP